MKTYRWEDIEPHRATQFEDPALLVDFERCIGYHARSVACKRENQVALGVDRAFLPVFGPELCDFGCKRTQVRLEPAYVAACPPSTLKFTETPSSIAELQTLSRTPNKIGVLYEKLEGSMDGSAGSGAKLPSDDLDIIYEQ